MLDKKEKFVILYLLEICPNKRSYLILAEQIAEFVSKKYLISTTELDDIMITLAKDNYIDFVGIKGERSLSSRKVREEYHL